MSPSRRVPASDQEGSEDEIAQLRKELDRRGKAMDAACQDLLSLVPSREEVTYVKQLPKEEQLPGAVSSVTRVVTSKVWSFMESLLLNKS